MVHPTALLLVQDALQQLRSVLLGANALSNDLDGVDQVSEEGVVDCGESSGARALLSLRRAATIGAFGARKNAARGEEDYLAV